MSGIISESGHGMGPMRLSRVSQVLDFGLMGSNQYAMFAEWARHLKEMSNNAERWGPFGSLAMKSVNIFLIVFVVGCGVVPKRGGGSNSPANAPVEEVSPTSTVLGNKDDGQSGEVTLALSVESLPACDESRRNRLFYALQEQAFYACSDEANWNRMDLKGEAGARGPAGDSCSVSSEGLITCGESSYLVPAAEAGAQGPAGPSGERGEQGREGPSGPVGPRGLSSLIRIDSEPQGSNCTSGGQKILTGIDDNGDGVLQADEEDSAAILCNGASGSPGQTGEAGVTALTSVSDEPSGPNCIFGGKRFEAGLDNGDGGGSSGDGILSAGEVDHTGYVCDSEHRLGLYSASDELIGAVSLIDTIDFGGPNSDSTSRVALVSSGGQQTLFFLGKIGYISSTIYRATSGNIFFEEVGCAGQAYAQLNYGQFFGNTSPQSYLRKLPNLLYALGDQVGQGLSGGWSVDSHQVVRTGESVNATYASYLSCQSGTCTEFAELTCGNSASTISGYPVDVIESPVFPGWLGVGWYMK